MSFCDAKGVRRRDEFCAVLASNEPEACRQWDLDI